MKVLPDWFTRCQAEQPGHGKAALILTNRTLTDTGRPIINNTNGLSLLICLIPQLEWYIITIQYSCFYAM